MKAAANATAPLLMTKLLKSETRKPMRKILLIEDTKEESELAVSLVQRGHIVAVSPTSQGAREKLEHFEFDWIICHRLKRGGPCDTFLDHMLNAQEEKLQMRLLIVTKDRPRQELENLPFVRTELIHTPYQLTTIHALLEDTNKTNGNALSIVSGPHKAARSLAPGVQPFIGSCPAIQKVIRQIEKVAPSESTVLLLGESGTGKELIAQSIHYRSNRKNGRLVPINCGAIPQDLLESELFGHVKGAFSGATADRPGRFAHADGGTLFLDEVGELPLPLQVKLLRVLQECEVTPLGSNRTLKVNVRIIAATNQNLEELVEKKLFREDLYYRLNVIPIHLPALRERKPDIPLFVDYFIRMFNKKLGSDLKGFTQDALNSLIHYPWPGNIRELRNFIERLAILNDGELIGLRDLPEKIQRYKNESSSPVDITLPDAGINFYDAVDRFEKALIIQALNRTDWNKNRAAALLDMNRTTLVEKIKKKEISRTQA